MGHVDHGKTSLLDAIRETNVTAKEFGGITQHIGAYQVETSHKNKITFVDTPGHEAFTAMRARGGQVADIVILVVAADEGVKPQTIEAINHAKAAAVPMIVAINKMDLPNADVAKVKQQLAEAEVAVEGWGGEVVCVEVSAKKKQNLEALLEMIGLVAEMGELKGDPQARFEGVVIESQLDPKKGPVATILVRDGTLKIGDEILGGSVAGKVKAMTDDRGERLKTAGPSVPVEVLGFKEVPEAGSVLRVGVPHSEVPEPKAEPGVTLAKLREEPGAAEAKVLNLVIKSDTVGTLEAVRVSLLKLDTEDVRLKILHAATGDVSESDVLLASVGRGIVVAFNVQVPGAAKFLARTQQVQIRTYQIIYKLIEDVEKALLGVLEEEEEQVKGRAEVLKLFPLPSGDVVLGVQVTGGALRPGNRIAVWRDQPSDSEGEAGVDEVSEKVSKPTKGVSKVSESDVAKEEKEVEPIYRGRIKKLKHGKEEAKVAGKDTECGILLKPQFKEVKKGDILEVV
ncbi:translation initiation factor IF-2 [Candidatus Parcubacteria bacterium]|nr:translation initiation factor IF-2 [Candidatus Parcubacteria bacterium]